RGDYGHARDGEDHRHEPKSSQGGGDRPREGGEEPVEGRAAALGEDRGEDVADRLLRHEEDERLVLVWRPHHHLEEKEGRERSRDHSHAEPERVLPGPEKRALEPGWARRGLRASARSGRPPWYDFLPQTGPFFLCRSTNTDARRGTRSSCSSGCRIRRRQSARSAVRAPWRRCSTRPRSTSRARGSTRPTTVAVPASATATSRTSRTPPRRRRRPTRSRRRSRKRKPPKPRSRAAGLVPSRGPLRGRAPRAGPRR